MTPIYDELKADWTEAIDSARIRGRLELTAQVLDVLKRINRPQREIKQLIADLESQSVRS